MENKDNPLSAKKQWGTPAFFLIDSENIETGINNTAHEHTVHRVHMPGGSFFYYTNNGDGFNTRFFPLSNFVS